MSEKERKSIHRQAYIVAWLSMIVFYLIVTGIFYIINLFLKLEDVNIWFASFIGTSILLFHELAKRVAGLTIIELVLKENDKDRM